MTNHKQALESLRDKVASGDKYETMGHTFMCKKAFPNPDDLDGTREDYVSSAAQQAILVWRNGSLDAAKALHEAVLPGWEYDIDSVSGVCVYPDDLDGAQIGIASDPARAWLLAILEALIDKDPPATS